MLVSKSFSIVGRATLIAEKSLAITTTAIPIAKRASQLMRWGAEASMRVTLRKAADAALVCATLQRANDPPVPQPCASPSPPPSGGIALGGAIAARDRGHSNEAEKEEVPWDPHLTPIASTSSTPP